MKNKEINEKVSKENIKKANIHNINKRTEIEKELNIQRNQKNKNKGPKLSDMKMNQLNYYNEIAKHNIHNLMNNPTLKDIVRITSNESVFDQLKAIEQSKDLSKILDAFPLKRVERINYKCLEIGHMRKDLGLIRVPTANYNKEKGKKFAKELFEKRRREGSVNHIPVLTLDNMSIYNQNNRKKICQTKTNTEKETRNKNKLAISNDASWIKKYKHSSHNSKIVLKEFKNENKFENNRYEKGTYDIRNNKDNNNLVSARIQVNKNKKNLEIENYAGKEKKKEKKDSDRINGNGNIKDIEQKNGKIYKKKKDSIFNNNDLNKKDNDFNDINNYHIKKALTSSFSDNKFNYRTKFIQEEDNNSNATSLNEKNQKYHFFSSNDIPNNISLIESKPNNKYNFNVKRSFVSNYERERINVKINDKLFSKKIENGKRNVNNNKPRNNNQPFKRFKFSKN